MAECWVVSYCLEKPLILRWASPHYDFFCSDGSSHNLDWQVWQCQSHQCHFHVHHDHHDNSSDGSRLVTLVKLTSMALSRLSTGRRTWSNFSLESKSTRHHRHWHRHHHHHHHHYDRGREEGYGQATVCRVNQLVSNFFKSQKILNMISSALMKPPYHCSMMTSTSPKSS